MDSNLRSRLETPSIWVEHEIFFCEAVNKFLRVVLCRLWGGWPGSDTAS